MVTTTMLSDPNMRSPETRLLAGSYLAQHCFWCSCNFNPTVSLSVVSRKIQKPATALTTKKTKLNSSDSLNQTVGGHNKEKKKRAFFLDVNPLCYEGSKPILNSFLRWLSLFLSQVSHTDPVIASMADDVVATLAGQVLDKGFRVVIASPDKDFKHLIFEDVQIVMALPELRRWSFYTLKHYKDQYNCDPQCDLSLRCIVGDEVDGVPCIQHMVPSFGRKTAVKLVKKHGSLE
ncbi:hypothetical protein HN873_065306 [Arachis hypogaea]|uniref:5'-3' exonuclease domain-containing protein n=1 Tax=Arachis hypogaea TaxID=3818 RepID=A0A444XBH1_ARAHY|nr:hypothetical protein Ahy_B09g094539 [Arachis hypogaea]